MTVAEYKRKWFDARRAELNERGLKDAHIAERMGFKRAYFSQVVNGMAVSDAVVDKMCAAFGFRFLPMDGVAESQTPEPAPGAVTVSSDEMEDVRLQLRTVTRLLHALLDLQGAKP